MHLSVFYRSPSDRHHFDARQGFNQVLCATSYFTTISTAKQRHCNQHSLDAKTSFGYFAIFFISPLSSTESSSQLPDFLLFPLTRMPRKFRNMLTYSIYHLAVNLPLSASVHHSFTCINSSPVDSIVISRAMQ
jgi:hypothetical protein